MRTILLIILVISGAGLAFVIQAAPSCEKPLGYRIGTVDNRFNLEEGELKLLLAEAEAAWEAPFGKDLLEYREDAVLRVDFVFDERQIRTLESQKLGSELQQLEASQEEIGRQFDRTVLEYERRVAAYEKMARDYQSDLEELNKRVEYWNERGGAPEDEYDDIQKDQRRLEQRAAGIEQERRRVNKYAETTGALAEKDSALVERYNSRVATFEEKYGSGREFDQGVYTGDAITIYQFQESTDLLLALVHEFGHALAIGHVEDPTAIMYPILGEQDLANPAPTAVDLEALRQACAEQEFFLLRKGRELLSKSLASSIL